MNITELAKKHGAIPVALNTNLVMTPEQLRAIIKEASAPLVEALENLRDYADPNTGDFALNALAEFNKEFGDD